MNGRNPFSAVTLESFAVDDSDFEGEIALAKDVTEFVVITTGYSVATGHRADGDPVVFIRSLDGGLHTVVCPDADEWPDPRDRLKFKLA